MTFDGEKWGGEIVGIVRTAIEREVAPLKAENADLKERLIVLEARPAPEKGEAGEDGLTPEPEAIAAALLPIAEELIAAEVGKAIASLPPPEKGEKGDSGERGEPGERGSNGLDGANGNNGSDGRGIRDLLIDRDGQLVATMSDGEMKTLGPVIGKDGEPGQDGRDGFGFDDLDVCVLDDDRTIELSFRRGEDEKAFTLKWPTVIDRGVYKAGETYEAGDAATWGGSLWIAQKQTEAKPDTPESGWRLAVKRGRDGKDARKD